MTPLIVTPIDPVAKVPKLLEVVLIKPAVDVHPVPVQP